VTHDDLNANERLESIERPTSQLPSRNPRARQDAPATPLTDREVPIGVARSNDLVHAWLDGELSEAALSGTESARHVDFWKRLDRDLESRRVMQTPVHLQQKIMDALPATTASTATESAWWSRSIAMSPIAVAAAAAGLLALGAVVGASVQAR
jgi:hypothetical protein